MQYSVSFLHELLTVIAWVAILLLGYREMKKYDKLKSTLQSRYGWDVDKMEASDLINRIYVITGIRKDRIAKLFILIREYSQDARTISAKKDIIEYIEIIKEIEKNLD